MYILQRIDIFHNNNSLLIKTLEGLVLTKFYLMSFCRVWHGMQGVKIWECIQLWNPIIGDAYRKETHR